MIEPYFENENGMLYYGDCLEVMQKLIDNGIKVDAVITDPPYGMLKCKWDTIIPFEPMWNSLWKIIKHKKPIILFGAQPYTSNLIMSQIDKFKHEIIWFKNVPTGMAQAKYAPMKYHENILCFADGKIETFNKQMQEREGKGKDCYKYEHYCGENNHVKMDKVKKFYDAKLVNPSSVVLFNTVPNRSGKVHPTQKPVALMEYLIKTYTNENETVLDFTMGSGTTAIAAQNTNRKWIGIEKEKKYCDVIVDRLTKG